MNERNEIKLYKKYFSFKVKLISPKIKKASESISVDNERNIITFKNLNIPSKGIHKETIQYVVDYPSKAELIE